MHSRVLASPFAALSAQPSEFAVDQDQPDGEGSTQEHPKAVQDIGGRRDGHGDRRSLSTSDQRPGPQLQLSRADW
jgi:hypothetical protein